MEQFDVILLLGSRLHNDGTPDLNVLARARRRLEHLFALENYVGWTREIRPNWYRPVREFLMKRDKRISNEAFEAYNAAICK